VKNVDDIDRLIGANLQRMREERGLSKVDISKKTGISRSLLSDVENFKRGLGKELIMRICKEYNVEPYEFYVTGNSPAICRNEKERDYLELLRKAEELGVAEDILAYTRFKIKEEKKKQRSPS
jgi:transcriptional regulator with XRE-family HTH domain